MDIPSLLKSLNARDAAEHIQMKIFSPRFHHGLFLIVCLGCGTSSSTLILIKQPQHGVRVTWILAVDNRDALGTSRHLGTILRIRKLGWLSVALAPDLLAKQVNGDVILTHKGGPIYEQRTDSNPVQPQFH